MNLKKAFISKTLPLIFCCFCGFIPLLSAFSQTPLDSIKQVLRNLNIPYEYQEEWLEDLEELEDYQNSPGFRALLAEVDEELQEYLTERNEDDVEPQKPKRKKPAKKLKETIAKQIDRGLQSTRVTIPLELAKAAEKKGTLDKAIGYYQTALKALEDQEKWSKSVEVKESIANLKAKKGDFEGALELLPEVKEKMRELGDGAGMKRIDVKITNLNKRLKNNPKTTKSPPSLNKPAITSKPLISEKPVKTKVVSTISTAELQQKEREIAAQEQAIATVKKEMRNASQELRIAERTNDYTKINSLSKKIRDLEKKSIQDEMDVTKAKNDLIEQQYLLTKKEAELSKQALAQRNLYGGLALLGLLVFSLFFLYSNKKRDHKKISIAYQELAVAQDELKKAEQRIKGLLDQQVSGAVANELIAGEGKKERRFVCVMFLDIRNFTPFVESKTPEEIIEYQNNVLGFMMEKVTEHKGIVNTVLGDGFMATFGAPISAGNDCLKAYTAAVQIMKMVKEKSRTGAIPPTKIGIGLHAGHVVAGNVGTKNRKQYLVTGNTVIIASRLEQLNKQYGSTLIISKEVVEQLPAAMNLPKVFDQVMVKGRSQPVQIAKYG